MAAVQECRLCLCVCVWKGGPACLVGLELVVEDPPKGHSSEGCWVSCGLRPKRGQQPVASLPLEPLIWGGSTDIYSLCTSVLELITEATTVPLRRMFDQCLLGPTLPQGLVD